MIYCSVSSSRPMVTLRQDCLLVINLLGRPTIEIPGYDNSRAIELALGLGNDIYTMKSRQEIASGVLKFGWR